MPKFLAEATRTRIVTEESVAVEIEAATQEDALVVLEGMDTANKLTWYVLDETVNRAVGYNLLEKGKLMTHSRNLTLTIGAVLALSGPVMAQEPDYSVTEHMRERIAAAIRLTSEEATQPTPTHFISSDPTLQARTLYLPEGKVTVGVPDLLRTAAGGSTILIIRRVRTETERDICDLVSVDDGTTSPADCITGKPLVTSDPSPLLSAQRTRSLNDEPHETLHGK